MSTFPPEVSQSDCLIAFTDLAGFTHAIRGMDDRAGFEIMSDYFEYLGEIIAIEGGRLVKCMGDAGLVVFPESCADGGVKALLRLRQKGDQWLIDHGLKCSHRIKVHFGRVVSGPIGAKGAKYFDVYGQTVNIAATVQSSGIALTAQAFRKLNSQTRKLFKKHTPPISYIPVEERHGRGHRSL